MDTKVVTNQPDPLSSELSDIKTELVDAVLDEDGMMKRRGPATACPPGLEYLSQVDQLIYKQDVHMVEVFCPWEKNNRFLIYNSMGQQVYKAEEETSCAMRYFCGAARSFTYNVRDNNDQVVLTVVRQFKCCAGCCWCANTDCCAFELHIYTGQGELLGSIRQMQSGWIPLLRLNMADDTTVGTFKGPCCVCSCGPCSGDVEFPLLAPDSDTKIAMVSKQWTGAARELFTDADTFSCTFPLDMDVRTKAVIFGSTFLVDMMFFQKSNN